MIESTIHNRISEELGDGFTNMRSALSDIGKRFIFSVVEKDDGNIQKIFEDFFNKFEQFYNWIKICECSLYLLND